MHTGLLGRRRPPSDFRVRDEALTVPPGRVVVLQAVGEGSISQGSPRRSSSTPAAAPDRHRGSESDFAGGGLWGGPWLGRPGKASESSCLGGPS